ncbi:hypothetical protein ACOPJQ_05085 [Luteimonas dalianensis]
MNIKKFINKYYVLLSCLLAGAGTYFIVEGIENETYTPLRGRSEVVVSYWQFDSSLIAIGVAFIVAALGVFISAVKEK